MATTFNEAWLDAELEHRPSSFWEPSNKLSPMDRIIRQLQLATQDLKQSNDKAEVKHAAPIR